MGLPNINIKFESLGLSAITRSERGIVAIILISDETAENASYEFRSLDKVGSNNFDTNNYDYIKLAFEGNPNKVIVEIGAVEECLKRLENKTFDWLTVPGITSEQTIVKSWISVQRKANKMKKAVLPNTPADDEAIVNFATSEIKTQAKTYTTAEYCARIAGILAGLPFTRSSTYYVLNDVLSIKESENPDTDIDEGKLILVNDGRKIKIGRGVNSLVSTTGGKSAEFKKIKIVEAMDLIQQDIKNTFEDEYIGKVNNSYDNKCLFLGAINSYLSQLVKQDVLDGSAENEVGIDVSANTDFIESKGVDVSQLSDAEIKSYNTGSNVYLSGTVKPLDSMEDLQLILTI